MSIMEVRRMESYSYSRPIGTPVVAIDVGTSRSAMSITKVGSESYLQELILPMNCLLDNYGQEKVDTIILLKPTKQWHDNNILTTINVKVIKNAVDVDVITFGNEAEKLFCSMTNEERNNHIFVKWFKMELYNAAVGEDPILDKYSDHPIKVTLSVAFTKVLEVFKDGALNQFNKCQSDNILPILWVVTVPAIWNESSINHMRQMAFDAGIISEINSENLILCLEPEGICFSAVNEETMTHLVGSMASNSLLDRNGIDSDTVMINETSKDMITNNVTKMLSILGNKFIVIDAGGGTVDMSAYEVMSVHPFKVKQLAIPTGGPYGSTQVDQQFMNMIYNIIGIEASHILLNKYRIIELEILKSWESIKIHSLPDSPINYINLGILQKEVLLPLNMDISHLIQTYSELQIDNNLKPISKGLTNIGLPPTLIQSFLQPSISSILNCLQSYRKNTRAKEASHLLLAGGYSSNYYLKESISNLANMNDSDTYSTSSVVYEGCPEMKSSFHDALFSIKMNNPIINSISDNNDNNDNMNILFVTNPNTAIVRGAAVYGTAHISMVTHRIARYTYGERMMSLYNQNEEEDRKRRYRY